ncbi:FISUMP domain-containing protein [Flavobacterium sp.]|jgi:uncharacterized protein (TIGR02145 family)|uniref:FISUMP domain-containing protein n=1 Tax=Flavobacterium sp. TaxID=239 RepID=UPI0037BF33BC
MQTKKLLLYLLSFLVLYGCSTSNDSNGNSTTTVVPVSPTNLAGTVISTTQINLSWTDNSTNETGFKIERKTGSGTYAVVGTVNADVLTYNDLGLTPNTTYTYRIYSYNAAGNSPTYSNEVTLITSTTDIDGNIYQLVTICNQTWMKSNLNVSHYRNGDIIPQVTDATQWANLTTGAWCYYNNDTANGNVYGKLYNWYAVNDIRGLAPIGFHIPTDTEWATLIVDCLGGVNAGDKMKETGSSHWQNPNTGATNSSGFTGLPGGYRYIYSGSFSNLGVIGYWWSSSQNVGLDAWKRYLSYNNSNAIRVNYYKTGGLSVRCIKD